MKRHHFPAAILLLLAVLPLFRLRADDGTTTAPRPNIVLCMADDQGWGDVGYRDHEVLKTPVMDEMAATGLRLDRFYAAAPVCSPTRGSVLTGRHPVRFGCFSWGHTLRPQEVTIAEAVKQAGYTTGHFGKWHLGPVWADSPVNPGGSGFDRWVSAPNFFDNSPLLSDEGKVIETEGESSLVTVQQAIPFIRKAAEEEQPFLAVVWFGSPHRPHIATEEFRKMYDDLPEKLQHLYGEITGMDHAIGVLRQELRDLNVADNTLFWYCSDNGALPEGSTGGLKGNKGNLYEGGLRVPAMIEWPAKISSGRLSEVPCGTVDIYPTILDLLDLEIEDQPVLDGISLMPLIEDRMAQRPRPLGFWRYPQRGIGTPSDAILRRMRQLQREGRPASDAGPAEQRTAGKITRQYDVEDRPGHAAWIDGRWKLHRMAGNRGGAEKDASYALYDLKADPGENENLAGEHPERVARMKAQLAAWQRSVLESLNGEDY